MSSLFLTTGVHLKPPLAYSLVPHSQTSEDIYSFTLSFNTSSIFTTFSLLSTSDSHKTFRKLLSSSLTLNFLPRLVTFNKPDSLFSFKTTFLNFSCASIAPLFSFSFIPLTLTPPSHPHSSTALLLHSNQLTHFLSLFKHSRLSSVSL